MDQCLRNPNLIMLLSEYLMLTDVFRLSNVSPVLRKVLRADEVWWPLYFREFPYRVVDRKTGGAMQAYLYCRKHSFDLENFVSTQKIILGILGNLKNIKIPDYMSLRHLDFYEMFSKPVLRKGSAYEITALSMPDTHSLEFDKEYIKCFMLLVNSVQPADLEVLKGWVEALYAENCTNFFVTFNCRETGCNPLMLPEVKALKAKAAVVCIEELTEASINSVLSNVLKIHRKRQKGKLPEVPSTPVQEEEKRHCLLS